MKDDSIQLIQALSNAFGVSGMEDEVSKIAQELFPCTTDTIKNTFIQIQTNDASDKPTVLLDAHADEVGFMVQAIQENGTLRFLPIGGWNASHIVSCPVKIKTKQGFVLGIVAAKPPHFMLESEKGKPIDFDSLLIDIGTSSQEESLALGVEPGNFIVPDVSCRFLENLDLFQGKAFDCRIGCACLLETLKAVENKALAVNVIGLLSAQEEVGDRGIECALKKIDPDLAICFEGCPSDDTFEKKDLIQSAMNQGVMLRAMDRSMITNPKWQQFALDLAKKYDIPYQVAVRKGGGTNGGVLHVHDIPTIVLGIPVRFAHSSVGFCSYADFEAAKQLAIKILEHVDQAFLQSLTNL